MRQQARKLDAVALVEEVDADMENVRKGIVIKPPKESIMVQSKVEEHE